MPIIGSIECKYCRKTVPKTSGNQVSCKDTRCQKQKRREQRQKLALNKKRPRACKLCKKEIPKESLARAYHPECRAEWRRQKSKAWYAKNKDKDRSAGPSRTFKGKVVCTHCGIKVPRTGASQTTCLSEACVKARRSVSKKKSGAKRRRESPYHCVLCDRPIYEKFRRRYHTECLEWLDEEKRLDREAQAKEREKRKKAKTRYCDVCEKPLEPGKRQVKYHPECAEEAARVLETIRRASQKKRREHARSEPKRRRKADRINSEMRSIFGLLHKIRSVGK